MSSLCNRFSHNGDQHMNKEQWPKEAVDWTPTERKKMKKILGFKEMNWSDRTLEFKKQKMKTERRLRIRWKWVVFFLSCHKLMYLVWAIWTDDNIFLPKHSPFLRQLTNISCSPEMVAVLLTQAEGLARPLPLQETLFSDTENPEMNYCICERDWYWCQSRCWRKKAKVLRAWKTSYLSDK